MICLACLLKPAKDTTIGDTTELALKRVSEEVFREIQEREN